MLNKVVAIFLNEKISFTKEKIFIRFSQLMGHLKNFNTQKIFAYHPIQKNLINKSLQVYTNG
jgi:hypothetical protein